MSSRLFDDLLLLLKANFVPVTEELARNPKFLAMSAAYTLMVVHFVFVSADLIATSRETSFHENVESWLLSIVAVNILTKHLNNLGRWGKGKPLVDLLVRMAEEGASDPGDGYLVLKAAAYSRSYIRAFGVSLLLAVLLPTASAVYMSAGSEHKKLPFRFWVPFDVNERYSASVLYQLFTVVSPLLALWLSLSILSTMTIHICFQMRILQNMLEKWDGKERINVEVHNKHKDIIRAIAHMNEFVGSVLLVDTLFSSIQICFAGFTWVKAITLNHTRIAETSLFFFIACWIPFVSCLSGNEIAKQGEGIFNAAYNSYWYKANPKEGKDMLLILTVASKPLHLQYKWLMIYDFEQYFKIMKAAYSYITLLKSFDG